MNGTAIHRRDNESNEGINNDQSYLDDYRRNSIKLIVYSFVAAAKKETGS